MTKYLLSTSLILLFSAVCDLGAESLRERQLLDFDWKFHRGDQPGAEKPSFDDGSWRKVDLPHDWSIEPIAENQSIFDQKFPNSSGSLPGGVGWYRRELDLAVEKERRYFLEFEGVFMNSDVWVNGVHLGNRPYGYVGFQYELTPHLKPGQRNTVAVRANVEQPCSRWFTGAGIYRHVWLNITGPTHVANSGVHISTPKVGKDSAEVMAEIELSSQASGQVLARFTILDPAGRAVASAESTQEVIAGETKSLAQSLKLARPEIWSLSSPALYTFRVELSEKGKVVDRVDTPFGIRTIEFNKDRGFLLNDQVVPIQGVCLHHDQGYLGAAAYDRAIERQLEILKAMGCNAIRTSHNPPAPKLLELCDRMGFLVMLEVFDEWKRSKTKFGYGRFYEEWSERDLTDTIRRYRNHPSIICWSIGNEIPEQSHPEYGPREAKRLADLCRKLDPERPVTAGCEKTVAAAQTGFADALDVLGFNYSIPQYERWKGKKPLVASETTSAVSSRGEYNLVLKDGKVAIQGLLDTQCTAYDLFRRAWATTAEGQVKILRERPWMSGEFVWTGFDYIGEPAPFAWPAVSSYFGIIDLCGFPKDRFYFYQSQWSDKPMVHLLPHWNWEQFAGKEIPVWCYSNADSVELFLNGKSLGEKSMKNIPPKKYTIEAAGAVNLAEPVRTVETGWFHQEWGVPFEPGTLKAIAKKAGQVVATTEVVTAGKPAKLVLSADRSSIQADGQDLAYVTVKVVDANGNICPEADNLVKFQVQGAGSLVAVGNGNPISHENFISNERKAWNGLCLAIIKAARQEGAIHLTASAEGLELCKISLKAIGAPAAGSGK